MQQSALFNRSDDRLCPPGKVDWGPRVFLHADFSALYPALASLEAGEFVTSGRSRSTGLGKRLYSIIDSGRGNLPSTLRRLQQPEIFAPIFCQPCIFLTS
jgi:hypothetical protein